MMLGMPNDPNANPFAGFPGMNNVNAEGADPAEDPMLKMLQQMMGGAGGDAGAMPSFPGMPGQDVAATGDPYAYVWRIVHAVFALSLGLYIAFTTPFTGSRLSRESTSASTAGLDASSIHFFYIFSSAEVLLQTSRFFFEKGRIQPAGLLGMVMGFLPEPWKGYLGLVVRYGRIWTTVSADAMVLVFVLGACAWWRGGGL
jgi:hypothetical protein